MFHARIIRLAPLALLFAALACTQASADPDANPFAGSWSGTYEIVSPGGSLDEGTMSLEISSNGVVVGGGVQLNGTVYTVRGRIAADGSYSFSYQRPGVGGGSLSGEAALDGGHLVATVELNSFGDIWTGGLDLAP